MHKHLSLQLQNDGCKSFLLEVEEEGQLSLFTEHTAEEFNIKVIQQSCDTNSTTEDRARVKLIKPQFERTWVAQHEHDDEVGSIAIECDGDLDIEKMNAWLSKLLAEKGIDIFRMKGFLSIADNPRRFVFQGVHMLFDSQPDKEWGDDPRRNQLVFIGRNLDEEGIRQGFNACLR